MPYCLLACTALLAADAMPIRNGRFAGGPTTVLTLTPAQHQFLRDAQDRGARKELILTDDQRVALQMATGAAPLTLLIYDTRRGENDCT